LGCQAASFLRTQT